MLNKHKKSTDLHTENGRAICYSSYRGQKNVYQIKPGYLLREIAGEYLAIPISMQEGPETRVAVLSFGGKFLWEQLQQAQTFEVLLSAMTQNFDVSEEQAAKDIEEFIGHLDENQLINVTLEERV